MDRENLLVRAIIKAKRVIKGEIRALREAIDQLTTRMETRMSAVDDELAAVQASQALSDAKILKVGGDITVLLGLVAAIPTAGLTPAQQTALDAVAAHAVVMNTNLDALDASAQSPGTVTPPTPPAV